MTSDELMARLTKEKKEDVSSLAMLSDLSGYTSNEIEALWCSYSQSYHAGWLMRTEGITSGFLRWIERRKVAVRGEMALLEGSKAHSRITDIDAMSLEIDNLMYEGNVLGLQTLLTGLMARTSAMPTELSTALVLSHPFAAELSKERQILLNQLVANMKWMNVDEDTIQYTIKRMCAEGESYEAPKND